MKACATFQRAMDIEFDDENDKFVVIYLDNITIFSNSEESHLKHIRITFLKCRKFQPLNPKKISFFHVGR